MNNADRADGTLFSLGAADLVLGAVQTETHLVKTFASLMTAEDLIQ